METYYQKHREERLSYDKKYYEEHREKAQKWQGEKPNCSYCGKTIIFKSIRALNKYKQFPNNRYFCDRECFRKSQMLIIDIPLIYCDKCGKQLKKNRKVFGLRKFWEKEHHFCTTQCQQKYYSERRKISDEEKRNKWRRYNTIGWERQRFREKILKKTKSCIKCGSKEELNVHHLKPGKLYPELYYDETNVIVLCKICHDEFHYGNKLQLSIF